MNRILVTGAEGFTGRYVVRLLAQMGHDVYGIVRRKPDRTIDGLPNLLVCDICNIDVVSRAMAVVSPTHILHLAGIAFVGHASPSAFYRVNILGTRALLEASLSLGRSLQRLVLASSASVYGTAEGILTEQHPLAPASEYAVSKMAMESLARLYADRLPITIARPFNYTGVGQSPNFLIPKIVDHIRRRAPVIELGNLDIVRDFTDVRSVADVYSRLLMRPANRGGSETFNICSGQGYSLEKIVTMAQAISGHALNIRINTTFARANEVKTLIGNNSLLHEAIGPIQYRPLSETIEWMIGEG